VFEDKALADESVRAVEKTVNQGHVEGTKDDGKVETTRIERSA
jgi:hypothetical protein